MVKRPLGLNKSSKTKKQKTEEPKDIEKDNDSNEQQAQIELDVDPEDELGQIYALYNAEAKEQGGREKILSGVVNECDRMLRDAAEKKENDQLPAKFHGVYAKALLELSVFADLFAEEQEQNCEEFLDTALDRVDVGLDIEKENGELLLTKCKILLELVSVRMKKAQVNEKLYETAAHCVKTLDEAVELYEGVEKNSDKFTFEQLKILNQFLELGNWMGSIENEEQEGKLKGSEKYGSWCKTRFESILEKEKDEVILRLANKGLGEYYLELADRMGIDEEEETDKQKIAEYEKQARIAVNYLLKAESDEEKEASVLPILAEAQIELANFLFTYKETETNEEANKLYKDGVMRLKKAQRMGLGDFNDMLEELQEEEEEEDDKE